MRVGTPGFVADRLTEGREARGLAQTALSELTGIKPQSISHYEQGRQSPSPEALALLCEKLELPERYFLKPSPGFRSAGTYFRSYRASSRTARLQAERRLAWVKQIAAYLRQHVDLPEAQLPAGADDVEQTAAECRIALRAGGGPLTGINVLLENVGCIVSRSGVDPELEGSYSQWDSGAPFIMLAEASACRMSFDAAHEMGHLVMHRAAAESQEADAETHRLLEQQADQFARAFLLPEKMFGREVWAPTIDALVSLKKEWNCPVSEMILRCGEIGVFDKDQVRRALVNHARRGWKSHEPHDADRPGEAPRLLARGIRLLIEEGGKHPHSVLTELALAAHDVEDLACLPRGYFAGFSSQSQSALRLRNW